MKKQTFARAVCILMLMGTMSGLSAAGATIGVVVADGSFHLDQARVNGNGTVFDGSRIETPDSAGAASAEPGGAVPDGSRGPCICL